MNTIRTTVAVLALAITGCAHADSHRSPDRVVEACATVAELAESVMRARQTGVSMSSVMRTANSTLGREIVLRAYEWPVGYNAYNRQYAINAFRDAWFKGCVEAIMPT